MNIPIFSTPTKPSIPSIESADLKDEACSWKEDSVSSTRVPSIASPPSPNQSNHKIEDLALSFQQMSKRDGITLINGLTLRILTLSEYINAMFSWNNKPSFPSFEIALLRSNNLSASLENEIKVYGSLDRYPQPYRVSNFSFKAFLKFLITFGDFQPYLLIMAEIYALRAIEHPKTAQLIQICGMKIFFGICLLLAFKFSEETTMWSLSQYCNFLGIDFKTLYEYEMFVVCQIFNFQLYVSEEELQMHSILLRRLGDVISEHFE